MILANILGPDMAIALLVVVLLFGGSQLPKLARSLGSASHEFRRGIEGGTDADPSATYRPGDPISRSTAPAAPAVGPE
jgi:sec-independent protein translocase protein TatA